MSWGGKRAGRRRATLRTRREDDGRRWKASADSAHRLALVGSNQVGQHAQVCSGSGYPVALAVSICISDWRSATPSSQMTPRLRRGSCFQKTTPEASSLLSTSSARYEACRCHRESGSLARYAMQLCKATSLIPAQDRVTTRPAQTVPPVLALECRATR